MGRICKHPVALKTNFTDSHGETYFRCAHCGQSLKRHDIGYKSWPVGPEFNHVEPYQWVDGEALVHKDYPLARAMRRIKYLRLQQAKTKLQKARETAEHANERLYVVEDGYRKVMNFWNHR